MEIERLLKENFICHNETIGELYNHVNAPLFHKDFEIDSYKEAKLYICGLGMYELFINGNKITKGKFAPYFSNPNDLVFYDIYDLTNLLNKGGNAISVLLGCGWINPIGGTVWGFDQASWRASERLSLVLVIDEKVFLVSDDSFDVKPSFITFNDLRCGEYVDARLYNKNDYLYGKVDNTFTKAIKTNAPKGEMVLCEAEPIVELERRKPINVYKVDDGYMYDFGENLAGIPHLKIKGHPGQKVSLWHIEATLDGSFYNKNIVVPEHDRFMAQKDVLYCSGNEDIFEPSFTYHGFRYIWVEGSQGIPMELEMVVLSSNIKQRATFVCSNETINKIQHITLNSDISNFYYFPTDCPQREKNGWTGDANLSCEQMMINYDCANSLAVWLKNIRKAQKEDGQIPGLVPTYKFGYDWGNGPNWDGVLFELPYMIYKYNGNKQVLIDNKDAMYKYISVNLKNRLNEDGLINYGLCDWCEAGSIVEYVCSTPVEVSDSLACIDILNKSAMMFDSINEIDKANYARSFAKEIKNNFIKKYVKDNLVICNTQTAQAMAIKVGVFEDNNIKLATNKLVELISSNDDLMKYGVAGNKVIYDVLVENNHADLAIKLITQDRFPSFKYWLDNDATSLWEAFNELEDNKLLRKDGGRVLSLNHHFWGSVSAFFYKYIAGINVNPSFNNPNEISIRPYLFSDIDHVKCTYKNDDYEIEFEVNKINNKLEVNIIKNNGFIIL